MSGFKANIQDETLNNANFRKVLFTAPHSQLVAMSLTVGEEIGMEVHPDNDQFFRIEKGQAKIIIDGKETSLQEEWVAIVPAGAQHNVINTGQEELKLYTIYSPAHHPDGTIHKTKADAVAAEAEH